jgi:hypothetical protein
MKYLKKINDAFAPADFIKLDGEQEYDSLTQLFIDFCHKAVELGNQANEELENSDSEYDDDSVSEALDFYENLLNEVNSKFENYKSALKSK